MQILRETDERQLYGEYDFWFATEQQMLLAMQALTAAGFRVGGASCDLRATVDTLARGYNWDIDQARAVLVALAE